MVTHTVLLVEDEPADFNLYRRYLSEAAGEHQFRCEPADRLRAAIDRLQGGGIDAILLDLNLPDSRGLATFRRVLAHAASLPIVILTGLHDENLAIQAVSVGAQDYLVKDDIDADRLIRALRFAIYRKRAEALPMTSDAAQFNQVKRRLDRLTMRERQVLDMLVQGKPLKQIAARLGTSPSTVKNQRRTIFEKLGATCDVDVVRMVLLGSSTAMSSASRDAGEVG
jgi:DNA-binding NarL/FixJ family response regulator